MAAELQTSSQQYATGYVLSKDGTTIGYRQFGHGAGVILVHGGMMAAQNFMKLGAALSSTFTVYLPDRRGRGLSGLHGDNYNLEREGEDIQALVAKTGATNIFGLSAGAIAVLQASLICPSLQKIALYEPPLPVKGTSFSSWVTRYDKEIAKGDLAAAMVTVMKAVDDPYSLLRLLPRFLSVPFLRFAIAANAKEVKNNDVSIKALIPTMHYEAQIVKESEGMLEQYKRIDAKVLLLGGSRSHTGLKNALTYLKTALEHATSIEFRGVGHIAADNSEKPELVAAALKDFYG